MIRIVDGAKKYSLSQFQEILEVLDKSESAELVFSSLNKDQYLYLQSIPNVRNLFIYKQKRTGVEFPSDSYVNDIIQMLYQDKNLFLFRNRGFTKQGRRGIKLNSNFHFSALISKLVWEHYISISRNCPNIIIFPSTPHGLHTYIRQFVASCLGVKVVTIHRSYLAHYFRLKVGFGQNLETLPIGNTVSNEEYKHDSETYFNKIQGDYKNAMPEIEQQRIKRNKGKIFNILHLANVFWYKPYWILDAYKSWKTLKSMSRKLDGFRSKKYVVFFMHYQPERTTLPEGDGFAQQMNAIIALNTVLPPDIEVLVKEHPATFTNRYNLYWRSAKYYRLIDEIEGVNWIDIYTDNFELIDNALMVGTITGTVGIEALLRGVPVVYFGIPVEHGITGQHVYSDGASLKTFVHNILGNHYDKRSIQESIKNKFLNDYDYTFKIKTRDPVDKKVFAMKSLISNMDKLAHYFS